MTVSLAFDPVATRRTFEEAVEQIADKIKAGDLHHGDRLPSERELAAQMCISRPTLREAIKALDRGGRAGGAPRPGRRHLVASEVIPRELLRSRQEIRFSEIAGVLEARRRARAALAQLAACTRPTMTSRRWRAPSSASASSRPPTTSSATRTSSSSST